MIELSPDVRYVTNSEMNTWRRCKRKWYLAHGLRMRPEFEEPAGPRGLGTRLHEALASYYSLDHEDPLVVLARGYEADITTCIALDLFETVDNLRKDLELGRIMLEGYLQWVAEEGVDVGLEVIAAEQDVQAKLNIAHPDGREVRLLGRLDVRVRRQLDDARMFIDHKSVGSFAQATANLQLDTQMLTYHLLEILEQLEDGASFEDTEHCDGAFYNMMRRVKRTARAKPPFYHREAVHHNTQELRNHYLHVTGVVQEIMWNGDAHTSLTSHGIQRAFYPDPRADCSWACDYRHVCPMMDDGSNWEKFLMDFFVGYNPIDRYVQERDERHEETDA